jgi:hypothetical protein
MPMEVLGSNEDNRPAGGGEQQLRDQQPRAATPEETRLEAIEQRRPDELEGVRQAGQREEADRLDVDAVDGQPGLQRARRQRQRQSAREAQPEHRGDAAGHEDLRERGEGRAGV